jgi:hypothetical protein
VLGEGDPIVSGHFVAGGKPYTERIQLWVEREEPGTGARPARWRRVNDTLEFQDGQGNFRIHGKVAPGRYRLQFQGSTLPIPPVEFRPVAKDLEIRLDPGAAMAASLLLPEQIQTEQLEAVLVPDQTVGQALAQKDAPPIRTNPSKKSGERYDLQWQALQAGTYTLEIRVWSSRNPLVRIPGVVCPPPEGGDPRLVDIDLRQAVRTVKLQLLAADGTALEDDNGAIVFPAGLPEPEVWHGFEFYGGPAELVVPTTPCELLLGVHDYRPTTLTCNGGDLQARLQPWPMVTLAFPPLPKLPDGVSLVAGLAPAAKSEARYETQWDSGQRADYLDAPDSSGQLENGRIELPIGDGAYRLEVTLHLNRQQREIQGVEPKQILPTADTVAVQIPEAQWAAALQALQAEAKPKGK